MTEEHKNEIIALLEAHRERIRRANFLFLAEDWQQDGSRPENPVSFAFIRRQGAIIYSEEMDPIQVDPMDDDDGPITTDREQQWLEKLTQVTIHQDETFKKLDLITVRYRFDLLALIDTRLAELKGEPLPLPPPATGKIRLSQSVLQALATLGRFVKVRYLREYLAGQGVDTTHLSITLLRLKKKKQICTLRWKKQVYGLPDWLDEKERPKPEYQEKEASDGD